MSFTNYIHASEGIGQLRASVNKGNCGVLTIAIRDDAGSVGDIIIFTENDDYAQRIADAINAVPVPINTDSKTPVVEVAA